MNYGKRKTILLSEKEKNELLLQIISSCVEYAGDSYENFARDVISILNNANLVKYGNETQPRYEVVKVPTNRSSEKYAIFDNEKQELVFPFSFPSKKAAKEMEEKLNFEDEQNKRIELENDEFLNDF